MGSIISSSLVSNVRGSVGNLTYSTNRYGPYVRSKPLTGGADTPKFTIATDRFANAGTAWTNLNDLDYAAWVAFSENFRKADFNSTSRKWLPQGLFIRCHVFRQMLGLSGNPQPVMPTSVDFQSLTVSRSTAADYTFTLNGGIASTDHGVIYYTSHPRNQSVRSLNTVQQISFSTNDYTPGVPVNKRGAFDVGFPAEWPVTPARLFGSVRVIHKESGMQVGKDWDSMLWPTTPVQVNFGVEIPGVSDFDVLNVRAISFTPSFSGVVNSLTAYVSGVVGTLGIAVYSDAGGIPLNLIDSDTAFATQNFEGFQRFDFSTPVPVVGGTTYWFAMVQSLIDIMMFNSTPVGQRQKTLSTTVFTDPFGASTGSIIQIAAFITAVLNE